MIYKLDNVQLNLENGRKYAISPIQKGKNVIKYGNPIGHAAQDIAPEEHVHTHNRPPIPILPLTRPDGSISMSPPVLEGEDIDGAFFDYVLSVVSGEETKNEQQGYREIFIFKSSVTL